MIRGAISRYAYGVTVATLTVAICVVAGFLLLVALPGVGGLAALVSPTPTPTPAATPRPTPATAMALSPIGIQMPKDANCEACHVTSSGTVGTKPIPKMGHPLLGFRECTACHKPNGLVQTAPGHSSLHKDDCLVCHRPADPVVGAGASASIAPMRPEHMGGDKPCTACHGVDSHAPLPENMKGRDNCWICHNGAEFKYLFESASPGATPDISPGASPTASPSAGLPGAAGAWSTGVTGSTGSTGVTWALVTP